MKPTKSLRAGEWLLTFQKVNQSRYFMEHNHLPGPKCNNKTKELQTLGEMNDAHTEERLQLA